MYDFKRFVDILYRILFAFLYTIFAMAFFLMLFKYWYVSICFIVIAYVFMPKKWIIITDADKMLKDK